MHEIVNLGYPGSKPGWGATMEKECTKCREVKNESEFYKRTDRPGNKIMSECKKCLNRRKTVKKAVTKWRQNTKRKLVEAHGGKCKDCGYVGPAFMYDFDHRNPEEKSFGISVTGKTMKYETLYAESLKCDLVCANCHRMRTHIQRCLSCEYCLDFRV